MRDMRIVAAIAATAIVLLAVIAYEVAVWRECLTMGAWWYCLRVLG